MIVGSAERVSPQGCRVLPFRLEAKLEVHSNNEPGVICHLYRPKCSRRLRNQEKSRSASSVPYPPEGTYQSNPKSRVVSREFRISDHPEEWRAVKEIFSLDRRSLRLRQSRFDSFVGGLLCFRGAHDECSGFRCSFSPAAIAEQSRNTQIDMRFSRTTRIFVVAS